MTVWEFDYLRPIKAMDYYRQIEANNRVYSKTI